MKSNIKAQSLEQGTAVLLLASLLVKIIGAFFKIPLASNAVLGDLGFGYFSVAYDIFTPVYTLALSGFPVAISRVIANYLADNRFEDIKKVFRTSRKFLFLLSILFVFFFIATVLPVYFLTDIIGENILCLWIIVPTVIICFAISCYRGYFEGFHNMQIAAISNVIEALSKVTLGLMFAFIVIKLTNNVIYAAAAALFGISIGSLASLIYLHTCYKRIDFTTHKELRYHETDTNKHILKLLIGFSVPVIISSLSGSIITLIDALTVKTSLIELFSADNSQASIIFDDLITEIKNRTGGMPDSEELSTVLYGIRSKAFTLFNVVPMLTVAVAVGSIPAVTESFTLKHKDKLIENINSVVKLSAIIAFPAGIGYFCLGERIVALLYGDSVSTQMGGKMLVIYGIASIFAALTLPMGNILLAINYKKMVFINVAVGIFVKITLNILLCSNVKLNVFGAVISTLISYFIIFLMHFITITVTSCKLKFIIASFLKPCFAAVICGLSAYFVSFISDSKLITVVSIAIAGVVYLLFLCFLKTFSSEEIEQFPFGDKILCLKKPLKK